MKRWWRLIFSCIRWHYSHHWILITFSNSYRLIPYMSPTLSVAEIEVNAWTMVFPAVPGNGTVCMTPGWKVKTTSNSLCYSIYIWMKIKIYKKTKECVQYFFVMVLTRTISFKWANVRCKSTWVSLELRRIILASTILSKIHFFFRFYLYV